MGVCLNYWVLDGLGVIDGWPDGCTEGDGVTLGFSGPDGGGEIFTGGFCGGKVTSG